MLVCISTVNLFLLVDMRRKSVPMRGGTVNHGWLFAIPSSGRPCLKFQVSHRLIVMNGSGAKKNSGAMVHPGISAGGNIEKHMQKQKL